MLCYLFVYGQLRRGQPLHHEMVRAGGRFVATAQISGTLFNLGKYTGAVTDGDSVIPGELYRFKHPKAGLRALDKLEGPEFRRVVVLVRTTSGTHRAWAFLLRRTPR